MKLTHHKLVVAVVLLRSLIANIEAYTFVVAVKL